MIKSSIVALALALCTENVFAQRRETRPNANAAVVWAGRASICAMALGALYIGANVIQHAHDPGFETMEDRRLEAWGGLSEWVVQRGSHFVVIEPGYNLTVDQRRIAEKAYFQQRCSEDKASGGWGSRYCHLTGLDRVLLDADDSIFTVLKIFPSGEGLIKITGETSVLPLSFHDRFVMPLDALFE